MRTIGIFIFGLLMPGLASAATLYFDPQERTVGLDTPFQIAVLLDAPASVNAFDVSISIPRGLEPVGTTDGGSLINYWIDAPRFDAGTRALHFSGIVPGGFQGTGARLLAISFKAVRTGESVIRFDTNSQVRRNTADAAAEPLTLAPLTLLVQEGRENLDNTIPDTDPPLAFMPQIVRDPALGDGAPMLVFATQDTGSGVARYEVAESQDRYPTFATWVPAESPYHIHDASLSSWMFVRAIDAAGNVRIETVQPQRYDSFSGLLHRTFAAFVLLCLILMVYARLRPRPTL
jgi:hypothetical protein